MRSLTGCTDTGPIKIGPDTYTIPRAYHWAAPLLRRGRHCRRQTLIAHRKAERYFSNMSNRANALCMVGVERQKLSFIASRPEIRCLSALSSKPSPISGLRLTKSSASRSRKSARQGAIERHDGYTGNCNDKNDTLLPKSLGLRELPTGICGYR